jgi:phosphoribosylanthranilate isomerase
MQIKICGLLRADHALVAAEEGATMLGFVFAPSRRRIEPDAAAAIVRTVRSVADVKIVGIFVRETAEEMNRIVTLCDLDYLQLSGGVEDERASGLHRPIVTTVHVEPEDTPARLAQRIDSAGAGLIHLDTARSGTFGGTGTSFDWGLVPVGSRQFLLAGGLHPNNVADAIRVVRPWGVDVSSGVETNGSKSPEKIRAFIRAARSA